MDINSVHLKVYTDASFNNLHDGNSQGGYVVLLCDKENQCMPIAWSSNKLKRVAKSTLAAETLAFSVGTDVAHYMMKLLSEILHHDDQKLSISVECYTDSRSLFEAAGTSNLVSDCRLRVKVSAIREMIYKNEINIKWIEKAKQLSDVLTKKGASPEFLMSTIKSERLTK